MHELGLTQEIVEVVTQRAADRKIKRIVLEIGKLSCVLPDAVRFCFDMCAEGTVAEGAELEILEPAGRGRCRHCGTELEMEAAFARCVCGSTDIDWISGEDLRIKLMELV